MDAISAFAGAAPAMRARGVQGADGAVDAGALIVAGYTKTASGFTATLVAAPGAGNSVTVDWFAFRQG